MNLTNLRVKYMIIVMTALALLFIVLVGSSFIIPVYNNAYARSCSKDADCSYACSKGAANNRYIDPYILSRTIGWDVMIDCAEPQDETPFCENGICKTITQKRYDLKELRCGESLLSNISEVCLANNSIRVSFSESQSGIDGLRIRLVSLNQNVYSADVTNLTELIIPNSVFNNEVISYLSLEPIIIKENFTYYCPDERISMEYQEGIAGCSS